MSVVNLKMAVRDALGQQVFAPASALVPSHINYGGYAAPTSVANQCPPGTHVVWQRTGRSTSGAYSRMCIPNHQQVPNRYAR